VTFATGTSWYDELRHEYTPDVVRVLLIAESPPDPLGADRRFFYSSALTGNDNLFRGVALAAYGLSKDDLNRLGKPTVLRRLQSDGFLLIDAVEYPVNHLGSSSRRAAIRESAVNLVARVRQHEPVQGVFICSTPVFIAVAPTLRANGVSVLNTVAAPFPLGNTRQRFVEVWRESVVDPNH
jgi:hypothetical protein